MTIFESLIKAATSFNGITITKVRKVGPFLAFYSEKGIEKFLKFEVFEYKFMAEDQSWPYSNNAVFLPSEVGEILEVEYQKFYLLDAVERPEIIRPRPRVEPPQGYQEAVLERFLYCPYGRAGEFHFNKHRVFVKKNLQIEYRSRD
jgi:hypothetical protein